MRKRKREKEEGGRVRGILELTKEQWKRERKRDDRVKGRQKGRRTKRRRDGNTYMLLVS